MDLKEAFFKAHDGKISVDIRVEVDKKYGDELLEIISSHFNKDQKGIVSISKIWFSSSDVRATIEKELESFKSAITQAIDDNIKLTNSL